MEDEFIVTKKQIESHKGGYHKPRESDKPPRYNVKTYGKKTIKQRVREQMERLKDYQERSKTRQMDKEERKLRNLRERAKDLEFRAQRQSNIRKIKKRISKANRTISNDSGFGNFKAGVSSQMSSLRSFSNRVEPSIDQVGLFGSPPKRKNRGKKYKKKTYYSKQKTREKKKGKSKRGNDMLGSLGGSSNILSGSGRFKF